MCFLLDAKYARSLDTKNLLDFLTRILLPLLRARRAPFVVRGQILFRVFTCAPSRLVIKRLRLQSYLFTRLFLYFIIPSFCLIFILHFNSGKLNYNSPTREVNFVRKSCARNATVNWLFSFSTVILYLQEELFKNADKVRMPPTSAS